MIVLDTDTLSLFHAGNDRINRNLRHFRANGDLEVIDQAIPNSIYAAGFQFHVWAANEIRRMTQG